MKEAHKNPQVQTLFISKTPNVEFFFQTKLTVGLAQINKKVS